MLYFVRYDCLVVFQVNNVGFITLKGLNLSSPE
jgi:hypothetical protein